MTEPIYKLHSAVAADLLVREYDLPLVFALDGFLDAGLAAGLIIGDVINHGEPVRLVDFIVDDLVDYRSRRPPMVLGPTGWESATRPELVIDVVEDRYGLPFLLMHGCEPDTRWESFAEAVVVLAKTLGVKQALSMYGVPFPVPHTRPLTTTYPTTVELLTSHGSADHLQIPGSAAALVELRLNQANIPAHSATVQVPQYLAAMPYPPAAIALMDQLSRATGLQFDSSRLATDADVIARRIDSQVADIPEIKAMVEQLEARWEANRTERVLSAEQSLPSAEEIAAELENFLATQQTDEVDLFRNLTENMRREPRLRRGPARDSVLPQIPPLADQTDRNTDQADPGQLPATDPPAAS